MKQLLLFLATAFIGISLQAQVNIVDGFPTEVYQVFTGSTFRSSQPKGETYLAIDATGRIGILQQSGAQVTQYTTWQNYRLNGQPFGSYAGAVDSLGAAIGSSSGSGGGGGSGSNFANSNLTLNGDRVHQLDGHTLTFEGDELVPTKFASRLFDARANDVTGFDNTYGTDVAFTSFRGLGNQIGDDNVLLTVIGADNVVGDDNSLVTVIGNENEVLNNIFGSAAFGTGHALTCSGSYVFGTYGICPSGGMSFGNGTDALNRSNSHLLKANGNYQHSGAYANDNYAVYQVGLGATIPDNKTIFIYDPASLQVNATILMPLNPLDGQKLLIFGGGTITSGNVVTALTLDGNGRSIIGTVPASLKVGLAIEAHILNNIWYIIAH